MKKLRVLFIGNSHTYYNDMPYVFKELAEAGQKIEVEVCMQAHPGVTYAWHLKQESEMRFAFIHGNYDYVVMQQAAHSPCPTPEETLSDGSKIIERAKQFGIKPVVVIPWAERKFPEHQLTMYNTYTKLSRENEVLASPVGYVFERVTNERPDIDLYWFDGEHCSAYGSYVNAICAYAVIFNASPVGLPCNSISSVGGKKEDMEYITSEMDTLRKATDGFKPSEMDKKENAEQMAKLSSLYKEYFPTTWNADTLKVALDEEKCAVLQKWAWEAVQNL